MWTSQDFFLFVSPPSGGTGWLERARIYTFTTLRSVLGTDNTQQVILWLTNFSWRAGLVKEEQNAVVYFRKVLFSSTVAEPEGILLCYALWKPGGAPGGKSQDIVRAPPSQVLAGDFNSQTRSHQASSKWSTTVHVFLPWHWFPWWFHLVGHCSGKPQISVFTCLSVSLIMKAVVCSMFCPFLWNWKEFTLQSVQFFLLLGQRRGFLAPYIGSWKLEVYKWTLNNRTIMLWKIYLYIYLVSRGITWILWIRKQGILPVLSTYFTPKCWLLSNIYRVVHKLSNFAAINTFNVLR